MGFKEISDIIYSNTDDRERMEALNELYYSMSDYIKSTNPSLYNDYVEKAEDILYGISEDEAEMIVREMRPYGEHWSMDIVDDFVTSKGEQPCLDYYLAMNMAYNDYRNTAQMIGMDTADFYYSIAYDFLHDADAKRHKLERYFRED